MKITISPVRLTGGVHGRSSTRIEITYDERNLGCVYLGGTVRFQFRSDVDEENFHMFFNVKQGKRLIGSAMIAVRDIINNNNNSHIWCPLRNMENGEVLVKHRLKVLTSCVKGFSKRRKEQPTFSKRQIQNAKAFGQTVLRDEAFVNPLNPPKRHKDRREELKRRRCTQSKKFQSALIAACEKGNKRGVELLLKGFDDTDVNIIQAKDGKFVTPLEVCAKHGRMKIAKLLMDAGADVDRERLASIAAKNGQCSFMMMMIMLPEHYCVGPIDTRKLLDVCARNGNTKSLKVLMNSVGGRSILKNYGERIAMILSSEAANRVRSSRPQTVSRLYQRRVPSRPSKSVVVKDTNKRKKEKVIFSACEDSKTADEEVLAASIAASVAWHASEESQNIAIRVSKLVENQSKSAFESLIHRARRPVTAPVMSCSFDRDVSCLWSIPKPDVNIPPTKISISSAASSTSSTMLDYLYGPLVSSKKKKKKVSVMRKKKNEVRKMTTKKEKKKPLSPQKKKKKKKKRETAQQIVKGHIIRPSPA